MTSTTDAAPTVDRIPKGKPVTGPDREDAARKIAAAYEAGTSISALCEQTGRSYGFIHRLLTESGVKFRARGGASRRKQR